MHLDLVGVLYLMTYLLPALVGGYQLLWFFFCRFQISHAFFLVLYRKWSKYCWPKLRVVQSTKLFVFCCSLLKNFNFDVIQFKRALLWRY